MSELEDRWQSSREVANELHPPSSDPETEHAASIRRFLTAAHGAATIRSAEQDLTEVVAEQGDNDE